MKIVCILHAAFVDIECGQKQWQDASTAPATSIPDMYVSHHVRHDGFLGRPFIGVIAPSPIA